MCGRRCGRARFRRSPPGDSAFSKATRRRRACSKPPGTAPLPSGAHSTNSRPGCSAPEKAAMRNFISCGFLLLAFGAVSCFAATASPVGKTQAASVPRVIEPGARLGPVTGTSSLDALRAALGSHSVSLEYVQSEDGKGKVPGAVIYPGDSKKRIELAWADTLGKARPLWARVRNTASWWHTPAGVRVGTTLLELEKLNGRAFTVQSFHAGERRSAVRSWNKGTLAVELEKNAKVWLAVPTSASKAQMTPLSQGSSLPSGDPPLRRLNPHVTEISVRFITAL